VIIFWEYTMKSIFFFLICLFGLLQISTAQERIAVLPFRNMDGLLSLTPLCAKLADTVAAELAKTDPQEKYIHVVPSDSVNEVLASLNLDPQNPQYDSDMWKAVAMLNITRVVSGGFNLQGDKLLVNAYIYEVTTKLADPTHQAKNLFKPKDQIMEIIPKIIKKLSPAFVR